MGKTNSFIFKSHRYDVPTCTLYMEYGFSGGGESFTETITFPNARTDLAESEIRALDKVARQLHLAAGISYYKAFCPEEIIYEPGELSREEAAFFYKFYLMGLGEFAVENDLDLRDVISFPVTTDISLVPSPLPLKAMNVVPIGGGKDSIVSLEALKKSKHPLRMLAVNAGKPIEDVMKIADVPDPILIRRKIDPALFKLNDIKPSEGGAYNGHVPITGILSFIMAVGAIVYDYDTIVMSNEQSANEGNLERNGLKINHQYSKSLEFEKDFTDYVRLHVLENFRYHSLLRPLSETGIACLFAAQHKYFDDFKSCNRNFHIDEGVRQYGWCCDCPKCRFVFLALSPFVDRQRLVGIFGKNMLDDPAQEQGFKELLGLSGHKPFECVGEIEECRQIMASLLLREDWQESALVKKFALPGGLGQEELKKQALALHPDHNLTPEELELLNDFIGTC